MSKVSSFGNPTNLMGRGMESTTSQVESEGVATGAKNSLAIFFWFKLHNRKIFLIFSSILVLNSEGQKTKKEWKDGKPKVAIKSVLK